jgi:hypothetical protein
MAYGTVNADVIQTSTSGGVLGAGNASIMKNRIINGAMVIDQRNAGASVTVGSTGQLYTLDRWYAQSVNASKFSIQQNAGSVTPPVGFVNYLGVTSLAATSSSSGDYYALVQAVEGYNVADLGWGTANAKTVTLSFQIYSSLTGTFSGAITNSAGDRSYPFTYTISSANTWTQANITIAGDTSGTWLKTNGVGMFVRFDLGMGSTYRTTANSWQAGNYYGVTGSQSVVGTSGATFYITGVQLEVGSSATGFEYENYISLLQKCQRYYWKNIPSGTSAGIALGMVEFSGTPFSDFVIQFPVQMRSAPSFNYSTLNTFAGAISSARGSDAGNMSGTYQLFHSGGTATGYANVLRSATGGTGYLDASAEL